MNRLLKYILISAVMILCAGYLVFAGRRSLNVSDKQVCSNVKVSVVDYDRKMLITGDDITALLKEKDLNPIGNTLGRIKTKSIEDAIEKHPMVRRAECYKTPSGEIQINVTQRTPILRVTGTENYYVDDSRKSLPISSNHAVYVPVFTGNINKKLVTGVIYDFAQFLNQNEFWGNQIDQVNIRQDLKVELVPRVGDHIILLGSFDRYEQKLEKLRKFYLYGLNELGWNHYAEIDLQYRDQVVCTRK
ncbi:MAG: cell division protein FtsQ/DivIB [Paludibacteraceae bacterium]